MKYFVPTVGAPKTSVETTKFDKKKLYPLHLIIEMPQVKPNGFSITQLNQFPLPISLGNSEPE